MLGGGPYPPFRSYTGHDQRLPEAGFLAGACFLFAGTLLETAGLFLAAGALALGLAVTLFEAGAFFFFAGDLVLPEFETGFLAGAFLLGARLLPDLES